MLLFDVIPMSKGLALLRASHSDDIALAGSRRQRSLSVHCQRSTLVAPPVLFAHAVVTVAKKVHPPSLFTAIVVCKFRGN